MKKISYFSSLAMFALDEEKMNYLRGGGDPIPPPIGGGIPDWQDDEEPYKKKPVAP